MKKAIILLAIVLISYWIGIKMMDNEMSGATGFVILFVSMITAFYLTEKNI